ncbi:MAG: hypothetical protein M5U28_07495 [Sandaracinaceae bacterium]|nr:hypothetical protein [Sandaracinaceae bacterium]
MIDGLLRRFLEELDVPPVIEGGRGRGKRPSTRAAPTRPTRSEPMALAVLTSEATHPGFERGPFGPS